MKKLMSIASAMLCVTALASLDPSATSLTSGVVGYGPTETIEGGISAGASFLPTGSATLVDLGDIEVKGYTGSTDENVEVQTLNEYGATEKSYTWKDITFKGVRYYGWYLDGEEQYDELDDEDKVTLQPGEGLWVLSDAEQEYVLQSKGAVADADVPTTLIDGGLTCVNPTPINVDLGDCYVSNYDGSTDENVEVQTLNEYGATDKSYTWKDITFKGKVYYGWYLDGEEPYDELDDEDKVTIKPGQGIWVLSDDEQSFTFVWPKVNLN